MDVTRYPQLYGPCDGYVFVVTYGRSGSTLTQNLLNAIPGYCIRGENGNLTSFLARIASYVETEDNYWWRRDDLPRPDDQRRPFLAGILGTPQDPWFGTETVDPEHVRNALMNLFVELFLQPGPDCRVAGFKEIRMGEEPGFFHQHLEVLRTTFPKARFLFQTRDHAAVRKSSWWRKLPEEVVERTITTHERLFHEFIATHREISFLIEYERFAEGPDYVREIFDFLGEKMDPERIDAILNNRLGH